MVRLGFRFLPLALITLFSISNFRAAGWPAYRVGSIAGQDVVTPVPLTVIDLATTERLRRKAAEKVPVCFEFRHYTASEVETAFHSDFALTRSNFLAAVQTEFGRRKIRLQQVDTPRFQQMALRFLLYNQHFPASTNLVKAWAEGRSGRATEAAIGAKLHEVMEQPIQNPATLPPDIQIGRMVRLISLTKTNSSLTAEMAGREASPASRSKLVSLAAARMELRQALPAPPAGVLADYLVTFVRPNCTVAADLTRRLRAERTGNIVATIHYAAGQTIVRRGDRVDPTTKAALDELEHRTALAQLRRMQANQAGVITTTQRNLWLLGAAMLLLAGGALLTWRRLAGALQEWWHKAVRRRHVEYKTSPASQLTEVATEPGASSSEISDTDWQRRALEAEHQARQAQHLVRAGLLPWLAGLLSNGFVQRLIVQRARLLNSHRKAEAELDRLGERLATVHSRMQDRLMAYEQRIGELERKLETRSEENRELIKAELDRLRREQEIERQKAA